MSNFQNCDYVLQYYEYNEEGKAIDENGNEREVSYIVMELCKQSLFDLILSQTSLTEEAAHYIFTELLKGVKEIHSRGYYHWDIKLENILLTDDFKIKIIDFGFCTDETYSFGEKFGTANYNCREYFWRQELLNE